MLNLQDVDNLTNQIEIANKKITEARLERDLLTKELKKKAQAYYKSTGTKLSSDLMEVDALRSMVEQQIESTLTFLENALALFHAKDYSALSEAVGIQPESDLEAVLESGYKEVDLRVDNDAPTVVEDVKQPSKEETNELSKSQEPLNQDVLGGLNLDLGATPQPGVLDGLNLDLGMGAPAKDSPTTATPDVNGLSLNLALDLDTPEKPKQKVGSSLNKPLNIAAVDFTQVEPALEDSSLELAGLNIMGESTSQKETPKSIPVMPELNLSLDLGVAPPKVEATPPSTAPVVGVGPAKESKTPSLNLVGFDSAAFDSLLSVDDDFDLPLDDEEPDKI